MNSIINKIKVAINETRRAVNRERYAKNLNYISTMASIGSTVLLVTIGPKKWFKTIWSVKGITGSIIFSVIAVIYTSFISLDE